jgi:uncharacterized protein (DUF849 family)
MIKAAINGARTKLDNLFVPIYSKEILKEAIESINAGAKEIHFHVRDENGIETLNSKSVADQISLLRTSLKDTPIGIAIMNNYSYFYTCE